MEDNINIFANRNVANPRLENTETQMTGKDLYLTAMGYKQPDEDTSLEESIQAIKNIGLTPMDNVLNYEDPMLLNQIRKIMKSNVERAKKDGMDVYHDYYDYEPEVAPIWDFGKSTSDYNRAPVRSGEWWQGTDIPVYWENKYTGEKREEKPDWWDWRWNKVIDEDNSKIMINVPMTPSLENLFILNEEMAHGYNQIAEREGQRNYKMKRIGPIAEMVNQVYEEIDAKDKAYRNTLNQLNLPSTSKLTPDTDTRIDYSLNTYFDALRHRIRREQEKYDEPNIKRKAAEIMDTIDPLSNMNPINYLVKDSWDYYGTTPEKFARKHLPNLLYPWWSNEDYDKAYFVKSLGITQNPHNRRWGNLKRKDIQNFPDKEYLDEYIIPPLTINKGQLGPGYFGKDYIPPAPISTP